MSAGDRRRVVDLEVMCRRMALITDALFAWNSALSVADELAAHLQHPVHTWKSPPVMRSVLSAEVQKAALEAREVRKDLDALAAGTAIWAIDPREGR